MPLRILITLKQPEQAALKKLPSSLKTSSLSLSNALAEHVLKEKVSFHTPGHKGFSWQSDGSFCIDPNLQEDLSESVPGLDELAYPSGIIKDLEERAAKVWATQSTLLSVNGATAGIIAAILMVAKHGTHLLVPRNCHRSVIQGLILSGLNPIWFEPHWHADWGIWGPPDITQLEKVLETAYASVNTSANSNVKIAGIIVVSPTYAGALADITGISNLTDKYKIPLIVDEAHGAHLLWTEQHSQSALLSGASIVIHSLHKTLSCPTQIGVVHITKKGEKQYRLLESDLRASLNLIQSSSPSYLFLNAIDKLVVALNNGKAQERLQAVEKLGNRLKTFISNNKDIFLYKSSQNNISANVLIKHKFLDVQILHNLLIDKGIFSEAILGQGLLFLLGIGSQASDIEKLEKALEQIITAHSSNGSHSISSSTKSLAHESEATQSISKPRAIDQSLSPRTALFMPSHTVSAEQSIGQISANTLAPCPPGWPVLVPGQLINDEILSFTNIKFVRILKSNSKFGESLR